MEKLLANPVLISGLAAWMLAQLLKTPLEFLWSKHWNWGAVFSAGGMPSSHSALMTSTALAAGLFVGFDTPIFALSLAATMIVVYDAAGVRRQAGIHAERINLLVQELFKGHDVSQELLKEVIGHTPRQVVAGVLLGITIALLVWWVYP
ncbi:MAG: divergent PAP2 family protein [Anaerolineaceae bacterium]|nr:divergent PAP2 family protein [Anaerolineaceae bacterium]